MLGKPLFPGTSTFNQLERILQYIPMPSVSDIASIASQYGPSVLERAASGYASLPDSHAVLIDLSRSDGSNPSRASCRMSTVNLWICFVVFFISTLTSVSRPTKDSIIVSLHRTSSIDLIPTAECRSSPRRFQNSKEEISKGHDVVPPLSDDTQLTVDQYRKKLYEVLLDSRRTLDSLSLVLSSFNCVKCLRNCQAMHLLRSFFSKQLLHRRILYRIQRIHPPAMARKQSLIIDLNRL